MVQTFKSVSKRLSNVCGGVSVVKRVYTFCAVMVALGAAHTASAAFENPLTVGNLWDFLLLILNAVIYIMFPIIVLMVVYTGFLFVSAQGNPQKIQEARRALVWTVVGALVILGSKAIALVVSATVDSITT